MLQSLSLGPLGRRRNLAWFNKLVRITFLKFYICFITMNTSSNNSSLILALIFVVMVFFAGCFLVLTSTYIPRTGSF